MKTLQCSWTVVLLTVLMFPASAQQTVYPYVIASGGGLQIGQNFSITATVGQPIAVTTERLLVGFWHRSESPDATSIEESPGDVSVPTTFKVHQNYPNPFNPSTKITFELPSASDVTISIVDPLGRRVLNRNLGRIPAGVHTFVWDGRDDTGAMAPSGAYWYRVQAGTASSARMMVLLK